MFHFFRQYLRSRCQGELIRSRPRLSLKTTNVNKSLFPQPRPRDVEHPLGVVEEIRIHLYRRCCDRQGLASILSKPGRLAQAGALQMELIYVRISWKPFSRAIRRTDGGD